MGDPNPKACSFLGECLHLRPTLSLGWEDPLKENIKTIPIFLPGKFHVQRSLVGYSPWGRKELGMAEHTYTLKDNVRPPPWPACEGRVLEPGRDLSSNSCRDTMVSVNPGVIHTSWRRHYLSLTLFLSPGSFPLKGDFLPFCGS